MARNFMFEEPNPTGSRPRDLIGLCKPTETLGACRLTTKGRPTYSSPFLPVPHSRMRDKNSRI